MDKYRLLNEGDKIKEGDEYFDDLIQDWRKIPKDVLEEIITEGDLPHRRKMKNKWRLLELGEIVKKGDQFKRYGEWYKAIERQYGHEIDDNSLPFRRRVRKKNKPCKGLKLLTKRIEALEKDKIGESKCHNTKGLCTGYRYLEKGEIRKEGDEYEEDTKAWVPIKYKIGHPHDPLYFSNVRRKCKYIDI